MIATGVKVINLKIIKNKKGDILKYLSKKDNFFSKFGEVYFSEIYKNKIKGWNLHTKNTCMIVVPSGKVQFTLIKNKQKKQKKITIGRKNYKLLIIPPGIWFSFKSLTNTSLVVNCIDRPHSPNEAKKTSSLNNKKII